MRPDQREQLIGGAVPKTHRRRRRTVLVVVAGATLLFGCSSDGDGPLSSVELPEAAPEEPAPEEPAPRSLRRRSLRPRSLRPRSLRPRSLRPRSPRPKSPRPKSPRTRDSSSEQWIFIVLGGLLLIAVVAAIAALLSRRSGGASTVATPEQSRLDSVLRNGRFFHDSTSLTLLQPRDAVGLQSLWNTGDRELVELQAQVGALLAVVTDPAALTTLRSLGDALTGLRGALDANVRLRVSGQGSEQAAVIEASTQTALARRAELDRALQQASYLRL